VKTNKPIPAWTGKTRAPEAAGGPGKQRSEIITLAVLFVLFRVMMLFWFEPSYSEFERFLYPFMALSNVDYVAGLGLEPALPFIDYWLEYPPVFPWIALGIYKVQTLITGSGVGAAQAAHFSIAVSLFLALVDLANLCLVYSMGKKIRGHGFAIRASVAYALLFFPLVVMSGYFDTFVLFTILLSLWALIKGYGKLSAFVAGVGIMTKFIPLILVPAAVKYVGKLPPKTAKTPGPMTAAKTTEPGARGAGPEESGRIFALGPPAAPGSHALVNYLGTLALTIGVLSAAFLFVRGDFFVMPLRVAVKRPGWETIRALAGGQKDFGHVTPTVEYIRAHPDDFGSPYVAAISDLSERLVPNENSRAPYCARLISRFSTNIGYLDGPKDPLTWPMLAVVGVLYLCAFLWMRAKATPLNITALAGITLMALLIYSHGWSPQFIVYVLPFALIGLHPRTNIPIAIIISIINFMEMPVWLRLRLLHPELGPEQAAPLLWVVVILRTLFLAAIAAGLFIHATSEAKLSEKT